MEQNCHLANLNDKGDAYTVAMNSFKLGQPDACDAIDEMEIELQLTMAKFAKKLSTRQRSEFGVVVGKLKLSFENRHKDNQKDIDSTSPFKNASVPTCDKTMRKQFSREDKNGMCRLLPTPSFMQADEHHCQLSLHSISSNMLANNTDFEVILLNPKVGVSIKRVSKHATNICESKRVQDLIESSNKHCDGEEVLLVVGLEFSDDCQPLSSASGSQKSAWLKLINLSPPKEQMHSMLTACPVALCPKGVDHDTVETRFKDESLQLQDLSLDNR